MDKAKSLDEYNLLDAIGEGSYGIVWLATFLQNNEPRAIKKISLGTPGSLEEKEWKIECHNLKSVKGSTHVNEIKNNFSDEDYHYIILEYLAGLTLEERLQEERLQDNYISLNELQQIFRGVLDGLQYCHSRDIVHMDLKPSNIVLSRGNEAVLIDFGLSFSLKEQEQDYRKYKCAGTRLFLAPEVAFNNVHIRSAQTKAKAVTEKIDIYSAGYTMLSAYFGHDIYGIVNSHGPAFLCPKHVHAAAEPESRIEEAKKEVDNSDSVFSEAPDQTVQNTLLVSTFYTARTDVCPKHVHTAAESLRFYTAPPARTNAGATASSSGSDCEQCFVNVLKVIRNGIKGEHFAGIETERQVQKQPERQVQNQLFDLALRMMEFDPEHRISAASALSHQFFDPQYPLRQARQNLTNERQDFQKWIDKYDQVDPGTERSPILIFFRKEQSRTGQKQSSFSPILAYIPKKLKEIKRFLTSLLSNCSEDSMHIASVSGSGMADEFGKRLLSDIPELDEREEFSTVFVWTT